MFSAGIFLFGAARMQLAWLRLCIPLGLIHSLITRTVQSLPNYIFIYQPVVRSVDPPLGMVISRLHYWINACMYFILQLQRIQSVHFWSVKRMPYLVVNAFFARTTNFQFLQTWSPTPEHSFKFKDPVQFITELMQSWSVLVKVISFCDGWPNNNYENWSEVIVLKHYYMWISKVRSRHQKLRAGNILSDCRCVKKPQAACSLNSGNMRTLDHVSKESTSWDVK